MIRAIAILASVLAVATFSTWGAAQSERGNRQAGAIIYEQNCVRCHGLAASGKGPDSQSLSVPPANFQLDRSRSKTDTEMMRVIMQGVPGSPMQGWTGRLTEQQMWDVLSYIRSLYPFHPSAREGPAK
jgi:mono/diheme cytochrome c family protein